MNDTALPSSGNGENLSPGRKLAKAREARGLSVNDVSQRLKFAARLLQALEADNYDALPSGTFIRGMVRAYGRFVGLDPEPLIADIQRRFIPGAMTVSVRGMHVPFKQETPRDTKIYIALSAVVVIAVGLVVFDWVLRQREAFKRGVTRPQVATVVPKAAAPLKSPVDPTLAETPPETPPPATAQSAPVVPSPAPEAAAKMTPPATAPAAAPSTTAPKPAAPVAPPAAAPVPVATPASPPVIASPAPSAPAVGTQAIQLTMDEESWVEIRETATGRVLLWQLQQSGTQRTVEGVPPLEIVIGNAAGVHLTYKGAPVDLMPYSQGNVARLTLR